MKIGFIGTGNMGNPMAVNLVKAGHQLTVHDLRREAVINLLEMGAGWADSPREAVQGNEAVFTSLPVPRDVEAVVPGEKGILEGAAESSINGLLGKSAMPQRPRAGATLMGPGRVNKFGGNNDHER